MKWKSKLKSQSVILVSTTESDELRHKNEELKKGLSAMESTLKQISSKYDKLEVKWQGRMDELIH